MSALERSLESRSAGLDPADARMSDDSDYGSEPQLDNDLGDDSNDDLSDDSSMIGCIAQLGLEGLRR
jgi:hypothetical protein